MNLCPVCNQPTIIVEEDTFLWEECKKKCISRCVGFSERLKVAERLTLFEQLIYTIKKCQTINYTIIQLND